VLLLIDTLRADRLGCYGYSRPTSPVMDRLARTGIRFAQVESQSSWTKSSMAALWTATYPASNGILRLADALPADATTAAEWLQSRGFRTSGLLRNSFVGRDFGFQQGFEQYRFPRPRPRPASLGQRALHNYRLPGSDRDLVEEAVRFLDAIGTQRFFLYLHFMDVHQYVYDETRSFGEALPDVYDASVAWVDSNVGLLNEALVERNLRARTLIVIASDHGETLVERLPPGHGQTLFRETTSVPLVISPPSPLEPGIVVENQVQNLDLWPTLLDLLGLPPLPSSEGRSLVPLIEAAAREGQGGPPEGSERAFAELDRTWSDQDAAPAPLVAVTDGRYRLIVTPGSGETTLLFDHAEDPGEQSNVAARQPEVVGRLRRDAEEYRNRPRVGWSRPDQVSIDAEQLEQLRALGYAIP
jgi:arylsulfatase A-like enzyme